MSGGLVFPAGFEWGTSTASYQVEGAWDEDGKGESIWDRFAHTPGRIADGSNGDVACDQYHRFAEDVAIMADLGLTGYRFSISWPRVVPDGSAASPVNQRGLDYYRRLVDALLERGITPFPTLYHWDLPQAVQDQGGWASRSVIEPFARYASVCAEALGDRVARWSVFNEPTVFTVLGLETGDHAPGHRSFDEALRASHVVNLAQAAAVRALRAAGAASVGSAISMSPAAPVSPSSAADVAAAERFHAHRNDWFVRPAMLGSYPSEFAPEGMDVRDGDMDLVHEPLDFIGVNLYSRALVAASDEGPYGWRRVEGAGPRTDMGWEVWPPAIFDMLVRVGRDYPGVPLWVTENGCSYEDVVAADGSVHDPKRIEFLAGYIGQVGRAIAAGVDVRGYYLWSFIDNFEWAFGYGPTFGIVRRNPDLSRTVKASGHWYGAVARANALPG
jgi:beta-glucosidase